MKKKPDQRKIDKKLEDDFIAIQMEEKYAKGSSQLRDSLEEFDDWLFELYSDTSLNRTERLMVERILNQWDEAMKPIEYFFS